METPLKPATPKRKSSSSPNSYKYLFSFTFMLLLTLISFVAVWLGLLNPKVLVPILLFLAMCQVTLQLFSFMHLSQKGSAYPILFIGLGCVVALTAIVAMTILL